ncbi:MAG: BON domain-containing protein [Bacteroidota bacterium]
MKTDLEIQKDVMAELEWEPSFNASEIGVAVKNGVVTLSGTLDSYFKKVAAEKAAKRVSGVKAVAEEIEVKLAGYGKRTDSEIAETVLNALKWHSAIKEDKIKVKGEAGIVTLEGEVDWEFQKNSAKLMIENLIGVRGICNNIKIALQVSSKDVKQKIDSALQRNASIDSEKIQVETIGSKVILTGKVRSWAEKDDAERAAWFAPGVNQIKNKLEIEEKNVFVY